MFSKLNIFSFLLFLGLILSVSISQAAQWKIWKQVSSSQEPSYTLLEDSQASFESNGVACEVGKVLSFGKGKSRWSMRTLKCVKGEVEVSTDVSCGGAHGKNNSGGFTFRYSKEASEVKPLLICE